MKEKTGAFSQHNGFHQLFFSTILSYNRWKLLCILKDPVLLFVPKPIYAPWQSPELCQAIATFSLLFIPYELILKYLSLSLSLSFGILVLGEPKPAKQFLPIPSWPFLLQVLILISFRTSIMSLKHVFLSIPLFLLPHEFPLYIIPNNVFSSLHWKCAKICFSTFNYINFK